MFQAIAILMENLAELYFQDEFCHRCSTPCGEELILTDKIFTLECELIAKIKCLTEGVDETLDELKDLAGQKTDLDVLQALHCYTLVAYLQKADKITSTYKQFYFTRKVSLLRRRIYNDETLTIKQKAFLQLSLKWALLRINNILTKTEAEMPYAQEIQKIARREE